MRNKDLNILSEKYTAICENQQLLQEQLIDTFGNLGMRIHDYFKCKSNPAFKTELQKMGKRCADSNTLKLEIDNWIKQNKDNPQKRNAVQEITRLMKISNSIEEFLVNLKHTFTTDYKKIGL